MKVYTITLTVMESGTNPDRLGAAIQKRFADVVLGYKTDGPFEVSDESFDSEVEK